MTLQEFIELQIKFDEMISKDVIANTSWNTAQTIMIVTLIIAIFFLSYKLDKLEDKIKERKKK